MRNSTPRNREPVGWRADRRLAEGDEAEADRRADPVITPNPYPEPPPKPGLAFGGT